MRSQEATSVVQLGLDGPVNTYFRDIIAEPGFPFRLEAIATASHHELVDKRLGETGLEHPPVLAEVPIIDLDTAIQSADSPVAFSGLKGETAAIYDDRAAADRVVFANDAAYRMDRDVPLTNAYVGSSQVDELFSTPRPRHLIAIGNCTSGIGSTVFEPLHRAIGLASLKLGTLQGWSGAGSDEVPEIGQYEPTKMPDDDEKNKLETEPNKFLGSLDKPAAIDITAEPRRSTWLNGHYIEADVTFQRPTSAAEIEDALRSFRAPEDVRGFKYGRNSPRRKPIKLSNRQLLLTDGRSGFQPLPYLRPMRVIVKLGKLSANQEEASLQIVGHNLALGAGGAGALDMLLAKQRNYIP
jgi:aspartate-semialdehyde dehydrogenase